MIIFSRLGSRGNLGNQMFQIASTIGIARLNNQSYGFPQWSYSKYFKQSLPYYDNSIKYQIINEYSFAYQTWLLSKDYNYDLIGWLQTERYFNTEATKRTFEFKEAFIASLKKDYSFLFTKKTILISVRRGDFVYHPNFYQLSFKYYFLALVQNFPDWKQRNIIFTSDDIEYCKRHFSFISNSFFLEDLSPVEQLAIGSQCSDFIISNSTFSWWIAWLGEKENTKIIRPIKNLRGEFALKNNDSDYFPERWLSFDETKFKINNTYFRLKVIGTYFLWRQNTLHFWTVILKQSKSFVKRILGRK
jgi:hypothetical protein